MSDPFDDEDDEARANAAHQARSFAVSAASDEYVQALVDANATRDAVARDAYAKYLAAVAKATGEPAA